MKDIQKKQNIKNKIDSENEVNKPIQPKIDFLNEIVDIREYDIPYYLRVAIDKGFFFFFNFNKFFNFSIFKLTKKKKIDLRVGHWYKVIVNQGVLSIERRFDLLHRAEPVILAFDIECTKQPLKFPDAQSDLVIMISYMIDNQVFF